MLFNKKTNPNFQTITLQITGMHCTSCSLNIDGELEDTPGVISSNTSYAKAQTQITFDSKTVNVDKMKLIISNLGYDSEILTS